MAGQARRALVTVIGATLLAGYGLVGLSAASPAAASKHEGSKISVAKTKDGKALVGANRHALYVFSSDSKNHSSCTKACRAVWTPVTATGKPKAGAGVKGSHLSVIAGHQVAYYGHPLYTYTGDTKAGQVRGQEALAFNGYWYLIKASGKDIF